MYTNVAIVSEVEQPPRLPRLWPNQFLLQSKPWESCSACAWSHSQTDNAQGVRQFPMIIEQDGREAENRH